MLGKREEGLKEVGDIQRRFEELDRVGILVALVPETVRGVRRDRDGFARADAPLPAVNLERERSRNDLGAAFCLGWTCPGSRLAAFFGLRLSMRSSSSRSREKLPYTQTKGNPDPGRPRASPYCVVSN